VTNSANLASAPATGGIFGTADRAWIDLNGTTNQSVGSYAYNNWLSHQLKTEGPQYFGKNGPPRPSTTPVFADAIFCYAFPSPHDIPAADLYAGSGTTYIWIGWFTIARHGSRPASAAPRSVDISKPLPGMINVALYDGHVEKTKLENLWNYYWNATWVVASPRPSQ
jgi:prepilin-type processing-associated H-X9-DG protein